MCGYVYMLSAATLAAWRGRDHAASLATVQRYADGRHGASAIAVLAPPPSHSSLNSVLSAATRELSKLLVHQEDLNHALAEL